MVDLKAIKLVDEEIYSSFVKELERQRKNIELIASENIVSPAVMAAMGSFFTNKYAEGYPEKRYYGGCEYVDIAENLAIERVKKLYNVNYANVQTHSGSQANTAVYFALLQPGDTILGMSLAHGGHLTHGSKVNLSGKWFNVVSYGVNKETQKIDYDEVKKIALETQPKIIVAGASAYPREIDFKKFREIADEVGAYLMVDMAHIAGLVAAGLHNSPIPYAHVVTSTTHKTLRGPRGGLILSNDEEIAKKINKAVFPGIQGGPLMHVIAAKAVAFKEALDPSFIEYQKQVINNAKTLEKRLKERGIKLVSDGTDNHLLLLDLTDTNVTGKELEFLLDKARITVNKNAIPFDQQKPTITSGIRIGTPSVTTRGMKEKEMEIIADSIADIIEKREEILPEVKSRIEKLCFNFPLYEEDINF